MCNVDDQVRPVEQFLPNDQLPWEYYPVGICPSPSYPEQPQSLLSDPHFSLSCSPINAELLAIPTGHYPYGDLHTLSAAEIVDISMAPSTGASQPQWSEMNTNFAEPHTSAPSPPDQHHRSDGLLCDWTHDIDQHLVHAVFPSSISHPLPHSLNQSYPNAHDDSWTRYTLSGTTDTCTSSPDGDTCLSALGFPSARTDYGFPSDARADLQMPIGPVMCDAISSIQYVPSLRTSPSYESPRQSRLFECQWLIGDALCETHVKADRRSVVEHLHLFHGVKPGEEKTREACLWDQCQTILNKESLPRHILTVHLQKRAHCADCGVSFAREDSLRRHLKGGQHKMPPDKRVAIRRRSRNRVGSR